MKNLILSSLMTLLPLAASAGAVETVVVRAVRWDASWKPASAEQWTKSAASAAAAAAKGADIVVFPEDFTASLAGLAPKDAPAAAFATRVVEDSLYPALKEAAGKTTVVLGAYARSGRGAEPSYRVAILDGGHWSWFDKTDLTPAESAALPGAKPGFSLPVLRRAGGLWAVVPGYSLQKTEVANSLKRRGLQLILTPSSAADALSGSRVLRVASSRAVELGAAVVVAAPAGSLMFLPAQEGIDAAPENGDSEAHRVPWKKLLELRTRDGAAAKAEARPFLDPTNLRQVEL